jgi:hypothetical protein
MRSSYNDEPANARRAIAVCMAAAGLCAVALAPTTAHAAQISDGSFISEYYNDGVNPAGFSATFSNIIAYTNGNTTQGNLVTDPSNGNDQADASATVGGALVVGILASGTTANPSTTEAIAETWDTLTLSNYPTLGGSVNSNTVVGTLNLTVNQTVSTTANATAATAIGLALYATNQFLPVDTGYDCGPVAAQCTGLISGTLLGSPDPATNGGTIATNGGGGGRPGAITNPLGTARPNPLTFSIPLTLGEVSLLSGKISYIAELGAELTSPDSTASSIAIDPSITLTGLYPGMTVSSLSQSSYSPAPLPASAWLFGSGLLGFAVLAGRRRGLVTA